MTSIEPWKDTLGAPDVIREAWTLAAKIAGTDFVPAAFRNKPEATMAALLTGRELGLGPMTALQRIHVIEGKPALDAQGQRALVLAAGHELWIEESTPQRCTVAGKRAGSSNVQTITWTFKEAEQAGLTGKQNWKRYPRQMLQARATAEVCRLIGADALGGLAYAAEELEDDTRAAPTRQPKQASTDAEPSTRQVIATKAVLKAAPPAAEPPSWDDDDKPADAELVDDEPAIPQLIPTGDMATEKQVKMALALCSGMKLDDKGRHDMVYVTSGGRTEHIRELTKAEMSRLIDELKGAPAANGAHDETPF